MKISYTNFPLKTSSVRQEMVKAFEQVLDSGSYIQGPEMFAFESEFARYCGAKHATGVANGTCGLHLMLRAIGVGAADEVITVPNSFVATAASIALVGAIPVFVDVADDFNIDPEKIEAAITPRTKAIIPVHLAGRPAKMGAVNKIAQRHGLFVLEDAAQAVGAKLDGVCTGILGDAASFSLHPLKNLHAFGDAGIVTTQSETVRAYLSMIRTHGLSSREKCEFWGYNCRLDELQAALLRVQLRELDRWTEERRQLAFRYHQLLRQFVAVPEEAQGEFHVYQTYVIQADRRDQLKEYLVEHGVEVIVHYPIPIHMQPAAAALNYLPEDFPVTLHQSRRILSLPLYPGLTHNQQDYIAELVARFYN